MRHTIRFRPESDGFWYELRDPRGRVVKTAWLGTKQAARAEANREREFLRGAREAA